VETTLVAGDWPEAERRLKGFLNLKREGALEARARFYLGQAYWFQGKVREATLEFLRCEGFLYVESRQWQDACIDRLAGMQ
jgi:TolA-binding protein